MPAIGGSYPGLKIEVVGATGKQLQGLEATSAVGSFAAPPSTNTNTSAPLIGPAHAWVFLLVFVFTFVFAFVLAFVFAFIFSFLFSFVFAFVFALAKL